MRRLFGLPIDTLTTVLVVALVAVVATCAVLAVRNRVFFRIGVRNVSRRPGRSAIIVFGLMLGTAIVASALSTGDTMALTIRSMTITELGNADESVSAGAEEANAFVEGESQAAWFPESVAEEVADAVADSPLVDGVTPAIVEPVALQDRTSRQTEPRVTLFAAAPDLPEAFGTIRATDGRAVSLADLAAGEVYVNEEGADEWGARRGDELAVLAAGQVAELEVADVVSYDGAGTTESALLMPIAAAQELLGRPGEIQQVLVSNAGGATSGVRHTEAVQALLEPVAESHGLGVDPVKQDGLDAADAQGNATMTMFTTFGTFTIGAGILLIFLVFVMLAAERRTEMGIARAIGTQRGHLVQTFMFEGVAYDLLAAAVGALLGIVVAFGMAQVLTASFENQGTPIRFAVTARSVIVAYALGMLLTFVVVTISAWRVSVLNVVTAIRNLPDPPVRASDRSHLVRRFLVVGLGVLLTMAGVGGKVGGIFLLGVSIVIIGVVRVAAALGAPARLMYTLGGFGILVWWLLPFSAYRDLVPELEMDFSVWLLSGFMVVTGATWLVVYNADLILRGFNAVGARIPALAPVLRASLPYALRNRFRTGATIAMFTLVVFTLVVGSVTSTSFVRAVDEPLVFGGGFDVRAETAPVSPVGDLRAAIAQDEDLRAGDFTAVAAQSFVPIEARQAGDGEYAAYAVRGIDDEFAESNRFQLAARAHGYETDADVWAALKDDPTLAVVDALPAPHRNNWNFGGVPEFQLSGFFVEDEVFDPVPVEVRDPNSGDELDVNVIGVLSDSTSFVMNGITVGQDALAPWGERAQPSVFYLSVADGVDATAAAQDLEAAFLANGMQAESIREILDEAVGDSLTFQYIILGFMGLGLVVGVAALGVISARAVVERRSQIGVLRAIGFQRTMVRRAFLLESSFVSLLSIVTGAALGLMIGFNVVSDARAQPSWSHIRLEIPWVPFLVIFAVVYLAGLVATWLPARRASRVQPSEALRYQ